MTPKAEKKQRSILDAAYKLFSEKGYEKTTMRGIAKEGGIAPGGIYHYFPSKAHIVQAYYSQSVIKDEEVCRTFMDDYSSLHDRLRLVLNQKIAGNLEMHELAKSLFVVAANPKSTLSPFSPESKETRERSLRIFRDLVEGADTKMSPEIRELLPEYLWLLQLGVILFWTYDESEGAKTSLELIDRICPILETFVVTIRNPLLRPFQRKIIQVMTHFQPTFGVPDV